MEEAMAFGLTIAKIETLADGFLTVIKNNLLFVKKFDQLTWFDQS